MVGGWELGARTGVSAGGGTCATGTPAELKRGCVGGRVVEVEVFGDAEPSLTSIRDLNGVMSVSVEERGQAQLVVVRVEAGAELTSSVLSALGELRLGRVATREPTLEDAYVELVSNT